MNSRIHFSRFKIFFSSRRQNIRFTFIILEEGITCHAIVWDVLKDVLDGKLGCRVVSNFISFFSFVIFDRPISKYFFTKIHFKRNLSLFESENFSVKKLDVKLKIYLDS